MSHNLLKNIAWQQHDNNPKLNHIKMSKEEKSENRDLTKYIARLEDYIRP